MNKNKIVTIWERFDTKSKKWAHNHISDGYDESEDEPTAVNKEQKRVWSSAQWRKTRGHLEGDRVIRG